MGVVRTTEENPLEGAPEFQGHGRVKDRVDGAVYFINYIFKIYLKS